MVAITPLIVVRKRTPEERTSEDDKLGMNAEQYTHKVLEDYLIPLSTVYQNPLLTIILLGMAIKPIL
jgi:hypothetical protein